MHVVNELNYPSLRYFNCRNLLQHRDFMHLYRKMTEKEAAQFAIHPEDRLGALNKEEKEPSDLYTSVIDIDQDHFQSFPFFKILEEDLETHDVARVHGLWHVFAMMWSMMFWDKEPEIVKGSTWNDAFFNAPDGYDEWLRNKIENGFENTGIIIFPFDQVCEFYAIYYEENYRCEISFGFHGKNLIYGHVNFDGFMSSVLGLPSALDDIAKVRHVTRQEAFFHENIYTILRWLYYKETFRMKPEPVSQFKKFIDGNGYTDFRVATDTPCVMFEKPVAN